ncbi:hypothetical protein [Mesorhizobium sp. Z1-4]|uniref:hypothetical protein n=1 Tax=Mesorhizobium sp. Z1-4 TaxID=2448478 RepID=UPI000FDC941E|nr:hypothetical protein [Mesorhizobium sp. Z1-4]
MATALKPGMVVVKKDGTEFVGRVAVVYAREDGSERMDVECIVPGARGLLHIYRPDQFRPATGYEIGRIERMTAIWQPASRPTPQEKDL